MAGVPKVTQTITAGGLGAVSPSPEGVWCVIGNSSAGTAATPTLFAGGQQKQLVAAFGYGPGVQAAAHLLARGSNVVFVKTANTVAGDAGTDEADGGVTFTGTGTSVITVPGAAYDDAEWIFLAVTGGTIGTAGITFKYSRDGGRSYSPVIALGTANTYAIPNSGITLTFAAGTLVAGDKAVFYSKAPKWDATSLAAAFTALRNSTHLVESVYVTGPVSATEAATIKTAIASSHAAMKYIRVMCSARKQNIGESEATWLAALVADYASFSELFLCVGAGQGILASAVDGDGSLYMRPIAFEAALRSSRSKVHVDPGRVADGPTNLRIVDAYNNLIAHDESVTPGLHDARFMTAYTVPGKVGVYIASANTMAPLGSDMSLWQYGGVILKVARIVYDELAELLSTHLRVDKATGYPLEKDVVAIEEVINRRLYDEVVKEGNAVSCRIIVSRTDNILSTRKLTVETRTIPLGYVKEIENTIAFENPALVAA